MPVLIGGVVGAEEKEDGLNREGSTKQWIIMKMLLERSKRFMKSLYFEPMTSILMML
jgi:hypothetical protein